MKIEFKKEITAKKGKSVIIPVTVTSTEPLIILKWNSHSLEFTAGVTHDKVECPVYCNEDKIVKFSLTDQTGNVEVEYCEIKVIE